MKNILKSKAILTASFLILGMTMVGMGIDNDSVTVVAPGIGFILIAIVLGIVLSTELDGGK